MEQREIEATLRQLSTQAWVWALGTDEDGNPLEHREGAVAMAYDSPEGRLLALSRRLRATADLIDLDLNGGVPLKEGEFDMQKVVDLLKMKGIESYVEQTGGGCATIYVKPLVNLTQTWEGKDGETRTAEEQRFILAAGPGWFEGPMWTYPRALLADFCYGPDDDGDSTPDFTTAEDTAESIADKIAAAYELRLAESATR